MTCYNNKVLALCLSWKLTQYNAKLQRHGSLRNFLQFCRSKMLSMPTSCLFHKLLGPHPDVIQDKNLETSHDIKRKNHDACLDNLSVWIEWNMARVIFNFRDILQGSIFYLISFDKSRDRNKIKCNNKKYRVFV